MDDFNSILPHLILNTMFNLEFILPYFNGILAVNELCKAKRYYNMTGDHFRHILIFFPDCKIIKPNWQKI